MPALIAESVKLFGITDLELCLFADPLAQTRFQGAVGRGIERTERQRIFSSLKAYRFAA